jgi:HlyD family secretion protein
MIVMQQPQKPSLHEKVLRQSSVAGLSMIALFAGTIGLWAATSTLSGAVIAGGQFVVDSSVKKIQHATGGIVGELKVKDGDKVKSGDLLVRLDETMTRANLQVVSKQLDEYIGRQARLEAERDGANEVSMPAEFADRLDEPAIQKIMSSERTLFDARALTRSSAMRPASKASVGSSSPP